MAFANRNSRTDAALEKVLVEVFALGREQPNMDFRFGIENAGAQQPLPMIFDLNHFTVRDGLGDAEDRALINPRVSGDYAVSVAWL
jgi:hypothetical protein